MPRFSIIVPTYRRADLLRWTLDSLVAQSFQDWEAIVVDDGSDDAELTSSLAAAALRDPRIKVFAYPDNRGLPGARNFGISKATGEYIAFLDSDDVYLPWTLEVVDEAIDREGAPSMIAGSAVALSPEAQVASSERAPMSCKRFRDFFAYRSTVDEWWFAPSGAIVKASVIEAAGGFWSDRHYCEDIDLWFRIGTAPSFVRIHSPVTYGYRLHASSMHHNQQRMYAGIDRILDNEKSGIYPGGAERRRERLSGITANARHQTLEIAAADRALAWNLYLKMLAWNLELGRWKFVLGFPLVAALRQLRAARQP